jgi:hypothetical protein
MPSRLDPLADVGSSVRFGPVASVLLTILCAIPFSAGVDRPLAAQVEVKPIAGYSDSSPLPKPDKILVYDFEFDPSVVQVDKTQEIRPRHVIARDQTPKHIGEQAAQALSTELVRNLAKTGLPVERASANIIPSANSLVVKGTFASIKQGVKTERVVVGMGTGSAEVSTHVKVELQLPQKTILVSEFETVTTLAKNPGAGVTTAAGLNPAVAAGKSTITDRKKTATAYASKTGDAAAKQISGAMAGLGWIDPEGKTKVAK